MATSPPVVRQPRRSARSAGVGARSPNAFVTLLRARVGALILACGMMLGGYGAAHAQETPVGYQASRSALAQRLAGAEAELANGKMSGAQRKQATAEVATLKERLENGDFRAGDLLFVTINVVTINKHTVDTATVREDGRISLTDLPEDISLKGVLRSEVQDKVRAHVEKYIKEPTVRVTFTTRVTILGAVARAGTYNVSPDRPLPDLVTVAGGGTPVAKLDQLEIKRGSRVILSKKDSKRALVEGKTLEQVGVQPGDVVTVPARRTFNWQAFAQIAFLVSSLLFALVNYLQYYYSED